MSSPTRVILVRHGRSTYNDQGRYQGSSNDAVLTEKGMTTARQVGRFLRDTSIQAVYSSPLQRVTQTVNSILCELQKMSAKPIPITIDNNLREIDLPTWEGLSYKTVKEQFSEDYRCWKERPHEFALMPSQSPDSQLQGVLHQSSGGGTATVAKTTAHYPVRALYQRSQQFWQTMLPLHTGQTVLIVSHGGTLHALVSMALKLAPKHHHRLQQSNCGISILKFTDQQVQLQQLNNTAPLGETLPKLKACKQGLRLLLVAEESLLEVHPHTLCQRLAAITPDFCLASREDLAHKLLQHSPTTLQLATIEANFLPNWQQRLEQSARRQSTLMTGIVIAPTCNIQILLIQALGGHPQNASQIHIEPEQLSIIHYPPSHRPVVQAINF